MAKIVKIDPSAFSDVNIVQVDVRAKDNYEAIEALESWAGKHGFARLHQRYLRVIARAESGPVFRGACYRMTDEEKAAVHFEAEALFDRGRKIPRGLRKSG